MTDAGRSMHTRTRPAWSEIVTLGALALACLLLVPKVIGTARYDAAILRFPFQVDDAEGVVLAEARLIADGTDPYAYQPSPAPYFYAGPYTPFYTLLNSAAMAVSGPSFKFGRAVQLLATLAVAAWLVWAVRRTGATRRGWLVGGWVALLFVSAHLVVVWSVRVRPDMTALAWNLLGVAVLRAWLDPIERASWRAGAWPRGGVVERLALGAACFALGWWTKQTFVAVPVAFLLGIAFSRPKVAVTLGGLYTAMIATPFALLTLLTRGGFAQKTIGYQGSWQWAAFLRLAQPLLARYGWWLCLAVIAGCALCAQRRRVPFAVCWFVLSAAFALGAGTSGGNHNHFVELLAAASLLVGQAVVTLIDRRPQRMGAARVWIAPAVAVAVVAFSVVALVEREGTTGWLARDYRAPTASELDGYAAVAAYIANSPGPVYSTNVGILVVTGQPVRVTDPFTMATEVRLGRWDDASLVADVEAGRYPLIALSYNDVASLDPDLPPTDATPGLIRAIQTRYRLIERNVLRLYVPK
ncbi:MAG: ArnT family glycosyltransferase [Thermomicrobiales bacterium]